MVVAKSEPTPEVAVGKLELPSLAEEIWIVVERRIPDCGKQDGRLFRIHDPTGSRRFAMNWYPVTAVLRNIAERNSLENFLPWIHDLFANFANGLALGISITHLSQ